MRKKHIFLQSVYYQGERQYLLRNAQHPYIQIRTGSKNKIK